MSDAVVILLGTLFGGVGLKVIESILSRSKTKMDYAGQLREEQRLEIIALREEIVKSRIEEQRLEAEIEKWRKMYYDLRDLYSKAEVELIMALKQLKEDTDGKDTVV